MSLLLPNQQRPSTVKLNIGLMLVTAAATAAAAVAVTFDICLSV